MTSFDYCSKCNFPRYIEGYKGIDDYLQAGWIKYEYRVIDNLGVRTSIVNWRCPVCAHEDEVQMEKELLMRMGSVKDPRRDVEYTGAFGSIKGD